MKFCGRSSCRGIWYQNLWMKHIQDLKKIEQNWVKLNEIGWNWVKLRVAIFAIFLTFVISCNFRQFWPIFVAVSGDLIGHFLYTSYFSISFSGLVLGCIETYFCKYVCVSQPSSCPIVAPIGRKKVRALLFSRKKRHLVETDRLARAPWRIWGCS